MNIAEFYAANEARRSSAEIEFGDAWTDESNCPNELSWVRDTGELYLMVSPLAHINEDLFFGSMMHMDEPIDGLSVVVIAVLATHEEVETALFGWSTAMLEPHSLAWLSGRFPTPPPALTT